MYNKQASNQYNPQTQTHPPNNNINTQKPKQEPPTYTKETPTTTETTPTQPTTPTPTPTSNETITQTSKQPEPPTEIHPPDSAFSYENKGTVTIDNTPYNYTMQDGIMKITSNDEKGNPITLVIPEKPHPYHKNPTATTT